MPRRYGLAATGTGARCSSRSRRIVISLPKLIVVSGPAGTGKTTLAHRLARAIPCPAISRDEIKEGMVHAASGRFEAAPGDALTQRTFRVFFEVLRVLLAEGVSVVAEAAFQDKVWRSSLEPLAGLAEIRIVQCHTDPATAMNRIADRGSRTAHADTPLMHELDSGSRYFEDFDRVRIAAPSIDVDTTDGYEPGIEAILEFVNSV